MDLQNKSASRHILVSLAIILVITAFVLVGLNAWLEQHGKAPLISNPFTQKSIDDAYARGFQNARTKYQQLCPQLAAASPKMFVGIVTSVSGQHLSVKPTNLDTDATVDHVPDIRAITISADTTIQKQLFLTPGDLAKQAKDAADKQKAGSVIPPSMSASSTFADLKEGQTVQIVSDQDVRLLSTIPAVSILILR